MIKTGVLQCPKCRSQEIILTEEERGEQVVVCADCDHEWVLPT
jgi:uncharacterized protein YbaR (Trm112 family)